jgi:hypothetical protein
MLLMLEMLVLVVQLSVHLAVMWPLLASTS